MWAWFHWPQGWRPGATWWYEGPRRRSWRRWCPGRTWPPRRWGRWLWRRCGPPPCTPADRAMRWPWRRGVTTNNPTVEPGKQKWQLSRLGKDEMGNRTATFYLFTNRKCIYTWNYHTVSYRVRKTYLMYYYSRPSHDSSWLSTTMSPSLKPSQFVRW